MLIQIPDGDDVVFIPASHIGHASYSPDGSLLITAQCVGWGSENKRTFQVEAGDQARHVLNQLVSAMALPGANKIQPLKKESPRKSLAELKANIIE